MIMEEQKKIYINYSKQFIGTKRCSERFNDENDPLYEHRNKKSCITERLERLHVSPKINPNPIEHSDMTDLNLFDESSSMKLDENSDNESNTSSSCVLSNKSEWIIAPDAKHILKKNKNLFHNSGNEVQTGIQKMMNDAVNTIQKRSTPTTGANEGVLIIYNPIQTWPLQTDEIKIPKGENEKRTHFVDETIEIIEEEQMNESSIQMVDDDEMEIF